MGKPLSRRMFMAAGAGAVVLGCGRSGLNNPLAGARVVSGFPDGIRTPTFLVDGHPQNAHFFLRDADGVALYENLPDLNVEIRRSSTVVSTQRLTPRGAGIPTPHYSLIVDVDQPGSYFMATSVAEQELGFNFEVASRADSGLIAPGEPMRPLDTPTFSQPQGVDPVCTRLPDPCPFHQLTVAEALARQQPLALLISTPGFCQTAICGPVLELLIEASGRHPNLQFIHAEVWRNPEVALTPGGETDVVNVNGLTYEPSLMVADASGRLIRRLDVAFDADELQNALSAAG